MTDREKAGLRGAVRKVVAETFLMDYQTKAMLEKPRREETAYLGDGRLDEQIHHNPDGSISKSDYVYGDGGRLAERRWVSTTGEYITRYTYDQQSRLVRVSSGSASGPETTQETYSYGADGAKTKVFFVPVIPRRPPGEGMVGIHLRIEEGSELGFGAAGAATVTTVYDVSGSPRESLMHNNRHEVVGRIQYHCDPAGRILEETLEPGDVPVDVADEIPEEARAIFQKVFTSHFMRGRATHKYDEAGHEIEWTRTVGLLNTETRHTRYNERGDKVLIQSERIDRHGDFDQQGTEIPESVKVQTYRTTTRFEYTYDDRGNWTEQTQWTPDEPDHQELRSMLVKRTLTYF